MIKEITATEITATMYSNGRLAFTRRPSTTLLVVNRKDHHVEYVTTAMVLTGTAEALNKALRKLNVTQNVTLSEESGRLVLKVQGYTARCARAIPHLATPIWAATLRRLLAINDVTGW